MGRTPMPTALKLLRGETRSARLNREAPKPAGGRPVMPHGMSERAQQVWRRQLRALGATGILTVVDADSLRAYCEAVDRYEEAAAMLRATGPVMIGVEGKPVRDPLHQVVRDNAMLIRLFARDLGFVPSAREGLHSKPKPEEDPVTAWIQGSG